MDIDEAAWRHEAYEALRVLMWKTDVMRVSREDTEVHDALTTLCEYLAR